MQNRVTIKELTKDQIEVCVLTLLERAKEYEKEPYDSKITPSQKLEHLLDTIARNIYHPADPQEISSMNEYLNSQLGMAFNLDDKQFRHIQLLVLLKMYNEQRKLLNEPSDYFYLSTLEEITAWANSVKNSKTNECNISADRLSIGLSKISREFELSEEKLTIIKSAYQKIVSCSFYLPSKAPNTLMTEEDWKMVGDLSQNATHFQLNSGKPIQFDSQTSSLFKQYIKATSLDLREICFDIHSDDEIKAFKGVIENRNIVKLKRGFDFHPNRSQHLSYVLSGLNFQELDLSGLNLNKIPELFDQPLLASTLHLADNNLSSMTAKQREVMMNNLSCVRKINLQHNGFSNLSVEELHTFAAQLCQFNAVDLTFNGFGECKKEKWDAFCQGIISQKRFIHIRIADLPPDRNQELQKVLKLSCQFHSLLSATRFSIWQEEPLSNNQLDCLPQELRDDVINDRNRAFK